MLLWPGLHHKLNWGSLQCSPNPLAGFEWAASRQGREKRDEGGWEMRGGQGKWGGKREVWVWERERHVKEGRNGPHSQNAKSATVWMCVMSLHH